MSDSRVWLLAGVAALTAACAAKTERVAATATQPAMERQIRNAVAAGEGDPVVRALRQRMTADPGDVAARVALARHYSDTGYPEITAEHCRLALERFPDSAELAMLLARSLRDLNQTEAAADVLERFIATNGQVNRDVASWLGILLDEAGKTSKAEQHHRIAIGIGPATDLLYNNLGYNLWLQGRRQEAAAEFRNALKLKPYSEQARNNLAAAVADDPEKAITLMQSMTDPATAHSNLAAILIEQGKLSEARRELEIALGYNKVHSAALRNLELVSRLDGKPAVIPVKPAKTRWGWLRTTMRVIAGG
jgi:Flp pilus assembly protein TadD